MSKTKTNSAPLLPFPVIEAAASGDVESINKVLRHYEGYIAALSLRQLYDEDGTPHFVIDNEMRRTLETRLIVNVLKFDLYRAA